jgi:hypothetical protein
VAFRLGAPRVVHGSLERMQSHWEARPFSLALALALLPGCGPVFATQPDTELPPLALAPPERRCDPTRPQAPNPLVTEWPASEKAHLESLSAERVVAVRYLGCELEVVPGCRLPGAYGFRQTTPSTDTLEIETPTSCMPSYRSAPSV